MSEAGAADKTEKPSAKKLRDARQKGQIARSRDMSTAIGVFVSLKLLVIMVPGWLEDCRRLFALSFADLSGENATDNVASMLFFSVLMMIGKMTLPLAAVPLCIVAGSLFPGGWSFTPGHFAPKANRLSPLGNLKRLVSAKHYIQVVTTILKALALGFVLWWTCRANLISFVRLQGTPLADALLGGADLLLNSVLALSGVLIAFSLIDAPVQQWIFMRGQRMSKKDLKDEYKTTEGKPEVKNRIRQLQRQLAQAGIRKTVPTADVVIVNPNHYAVAIKYDDSKAQAPYVVAKGIDETALFIRQVAKECRIEVLEAPPLARAIYNTSQVNQQIPAALYRAVAQVLTYVLQIKAFRNGQRSARPGPPAGFDIPDHLTRTHES